MGPRKGHLCRHISKAFGIDPYGEEAQYLSGYVGQKMFPVAKKFLCEHCRKGLENNNRTEAFFDLLELPFLQNSREIIYINPIKLYILIIDIYIGITNTLFYL